MFWYERVVCFILAAWKWDMENDGIVELQGLKNSSLMAWEDKEKVGN